MRFSEILEQLPELSTLDKFRLIQEHDPKFFFEIQSYHTQNMHNLRLLREMQTQMQALSEQVIEYRALNLEYGRIIQQLVNSSKNET